MYCVECCNLKLNSNICIDKKIYMLQVKSKIQIDISKEMSISAKPMYSFIRGHLFTQFHLFIQFIPKPKSTWIITIFQTINLSRLECGLR